MDKEKIEKKMREASEAEAKRAKPRRGAGDSDGAGVPTAAGKPGKAAGKHKPQREEPAAPPDDGISVHLTLPEMTGLVLARLSQQPDQDLLLYGGVLHRILRREDDGVVRYVTQQHSDESLLGHIARKVPFVRLDRDERWQPADPPMRLIKDLRALPGYPPGIPVLDHIKDVPLFTRDGELIATSGLHPEHRVFLSLDPALEGMTLPGEITQADLDAALDVICDPFQDFPLDDESSTANLLGMLFAMVFRDCVGGLTPLFVVDANHASTGKGTLLSAMSAIAYGGPAEFSSGEIGSKEIGKRLLALGTQGARFHVLDNVEQIVWSPVLAAFLTSTTWSDRVLGVTQMYSFPNRMIIAITGNHVRLGGDLARRTVLIRLRNEHERPDERGDYRYTHLIEHILGERPKILRAMYTVAAAWHRGGRLVPESTPHIGSFQGWADFSAGILDALGGFVGLLGNRDAVRGRDSNAEEYALMLVRGRQHFGARTFFAKELLSALEAEDMPTCVGSSSQGSLTRRMGRLLVRIEDRAFGDDGLTIRAAGEENHTRRYRIESREDRAAAPRVIDNDNNDTAED